MKIDSENLITTNILTIPDRRLISRVRTLINRIDKGEIKSDVDKTHQPLLYTKLVFKSTDIKRKLYIVSLADSLYVIVSYTRSLNEEDDIVKYTFCISNDDPKTSVNDMKLKAIKEIIFYEKEHKIIDIKPGLTVVKK